jgi:hypothetical protein
MNRLETEKTETVTQADLLADLEAVCQQAAGGGPGNPELVRRIQERAKKARQQILEEFGVQSIGVQIIREMRDGRDT